MVAGASIVKETLAHPSHNTGTIECGVTPTFPLDRGSACLRSGESTTVAKGEAEGTITHPVNKEDTVPKAQRARSKNCGTAGEMSRTSSSRHRSIDTTRVPPEITSPVQVER